MAARPIATSMISFGLVSLPVKLYSTAESGTKVSFNMLHKETGNRLKQQYVDAQTGDLVSRDAMVKGYEFAKNQYVVFDPEELKAIEAQSTDSIDIVEFVPAEDVDRLYFQKGYFLGPDKGGARAYRLLAAALRDAGRVAIAKYAARGKMYLTMIRPVDDGLLMEQLYYPDEVRSFADVPMEEGEVNETELELAKQLIAQASVDAFDPTKFSDDVRGRVLELINRKVEGEEITISAQEEPETKIIDLMEALKASLAASGDAGRKAPQRAAKKDEATSARKKASAG